jgi:NADPH:quinone reductase
VQIAKKEGLQVLATAGSAEGKEILQNLGADFVFDHKSADYMEQIKVGLEVGYLTNLLLS